MSRGAKEGRNFRQNPRSLHRIPGAPRLAFETWDTTALNPKLRSFEPMDTGSQPLRKRRDFSPLSLDPTTCQPDRSAPEGSAVLPRLPAPGETPEYTLPYLPGGPTGGSVRPSMSYIGWTAFTCGFSSATETASTRIFGLSGRVKVCAPCGNGSEYANRYAYW